MDIELKPCPMCGSDARIRNHRVAGDSLRENLNKVWIECTNDDKCGLRQTMFGYTQEAVTAWSRREAQRWILVSERLPEDHQPVLFTERFVDEAYRGYFLQGDFNVSSTGLQINGNASLETDIEQKDITHWMPLPAAPAGDQQ